MNLTAEEQQLLLYLVEKELSEMLKEGRTLVPDLSFLEAEAEYELFLQKLHEKLK